MMALMILSALLVLVGSALLAVVASTPKGWDERRLNIAFSLALAAHLSAVVLALAMMWEGLL